MARQTRIVDVARAAGVSVGTVSNVLNRPAMVADETRERVLAAIAELGFVRNESARQLRAGHSRAIGLIVIDAANPFFTDVARGVEDAVFEAGSVVLLGNSAGDVERQRRYLDLFEEQRVRGVLLAPSADEAPDLSGLARLRIPVVFMDRAATDETHSSVSVDDRVGGRLAAQHLLGQGHRRLAFVGGPSTLRQVRERREGAEEVVGSARGAQLLALSTPALTTGAGRRATDELMAWPAEDRPTGLLAANDLVALGLLQGLASYGVRVPADMALVGYDDIEFAAAAATPLSSIRQPREELGRTGASLLFRAIEALEAGQPALPPEHRVFQPELVVRVSSQYPRLDHAV